ncbi:TPA: hypothetical protein DCY43_00430 [candidate division WWE3 bacterium]|uniref:Uncharacterized protein n=1 Tax=candidate division WWE3 bacterium TaxID=2053526 RepID=A0A351JSD8_UNCKA|nr:hypothetical protein [candidate division WWE3 bacterium]
MPPNEDSNILIGKFGKEVAAAKPRTWALIVLISFVISPLGIVLALFFVFRAIKSHQRQLYLMALAALLAAIAGLGALYGIRSLLYNRKLDHYTYSALEDYKLSGNLKNAAITFKKPAEFKVYYQNYKAGSSVAGLSHNLDKDGQKKAIGYIAVSGLVNTETQDSAYLKKLSTALTSPEATDYQKFSQPIKDFAANYLPDNFDVNLANPRAFTSSNIVKNAWLFDLSVQSKASQKATPLKGSVILVSGKNSFYYFMLTSIDYNWQTNKAIWQQILNSLKPDQ